MTQPSQEDRAVARRFASSADLQDRIAHAIAQARAEGRAAGMEAALEIASAIEITAPGLDICTWGEGVGDGIGAARETIVDAIRAASKEATK